MKKIIDISGFGHSGKTVVSDYLKSMKCIYSFPNYVEFELFRVDSGLVDLYQNLFQNWNLIRSSSKLKKFKKLIDRIGKVQQKTMISTFWEASGHGYNKYFNNKFIEISNRFIEKLIIETQEQFWPYELLSVSKYELLKKKVKRKLFKKEITSNVLYTKKDDFLLRVHDYLNELFNELGSENQTHVILNNCFEPFNPQPCFDMAPNSVSIIVDRDPRDIFASLININDLFIPDFEKYNGNEELKKKIVGFDNIEFFIARYKLLRENITISPNNERLLRISYEDFVLNFQVFSEKINNFIQLKNPQRIELDFDINKSKKNVGIWQNYRDTKEIKLIESKLGKYCYNF